MAHEHSNLGAWIARLREQDPSLTVKASVDAIDAEALDNAVGFAAEHARRYIATDGADDGWESSMRTSSGAHSSSSAATCCGAGAHLAGRARHRGPGVRRDAAAAGAHADREELGVAGHDVDVVERHAQLRRADLRQRRLVALALRGHADGRRTPGRSDRRGPARPRTGPMPEPWT